MLVAFALALVSQQVGERRLVYRPEPGMTSVYWFTATVEQTEGPPHPLVGEVSINISTVEIRTVIQQSDFKTTIKVVTYWNGLSDILARIRYIGIAFPEGMGGPIESTVELDALGQIIPASLKNEALNPDWPHSTFHLFAVNQISILGPFPVRPFDSQIRWAIDARELSPIIGLFSSLSPDGQFVIYCSGSIVPDRDELKVLIGLPEQKLGISRISGEGEAIIRLSTGEIESLDLSFVQTIDGNGYGLDLAFRYRYTVQRVAEFATPDDDG